jgi:hypothetical protein
MTRYELTPTNGRKSFYHKAIVEVADDGAETLYSYNTPVLRKEPQPNGAVHYVRLWDGWSLTTGRHIWAWARIGNHEFEMMEVAQ